MRIVENPTTAPPLDYYVEARDRFTGDVATELAVMLIDYVRESRQLDQQQTHAEEAQLRLAQAAQVHDMREEADKIRDAGMIKGLGMIASGGSTIGSGVALASGSEAWATGLEGSAGAANGVGEAWAADVDRSAALARTHATEHEHQAGESERRLDVLDEARSHAKQLEQSAFEHLRSVQQTRADTERASITWRA